MCLSFQYCSSRLSPFSTVQRVSPLFLSVTLPLQQCSLCVFMVSAAQEEELARLYNILEAQRGEIENLNQMLDYLATQGPDGGLFPLTCFVAFC